MSILMNISIIFLTITAIHYIRYSESNGFDRMLKIGTAIALMLIALYNLYEWKDHNDTMHLVDYIISQIAMLGYGYYIMNKYDKEG